MVRAAIALISLALFLAVYMLAAPAILEPLIEAFLEYPFMGEHESTMRDLETVMYRWVPLATIGVMLVIVAIWLVRRRQVQVGTRVR